MKFSHQQLTVLKTLAYAWVFDFPLTFDELYQRQLISPHHKTLSLKQISEIVQNCTVLSVKDLRVFFKKNPEILKMNTQRLRWSEKKWREVEKIKQFLTFIPFIQAVYITGSLAMNNLSHAEDDIDILVVTKINRLWLTRALLVPLAILLGKYRFHQSKTQTGWCFNLWLDESALAMNNERHSLYTAYEIVQAKQIKGSINVLLEANLWLEKFLPAWKVSKSSSKPTVAQPSGFMLSTVNNFAFQLQWWLMRSHHTTEKVGLHSAFFHPRNTQQQITKKFEKIMKSFE